MDKGSLLELESSTVFIRILKSIL